MQNKLLNLNNKFQQPRKMVRRVTETIQNLLLWTTHFISYHVKENKPVLFQLWTSFQSSHCQSLQNTSKDGEHLTRLTLFELSPGHPICPILSQECVSPPFLLQSFLSLWSHCLISLFPDGEEFQPPYSRTHPQTQTMPLSVPSFFLSGFDESRDGWERGVRRKCLDLRRLR